MRPGLRQIRFSQFILCCAIFVMIACGPQRADDPVVIGAETSPDSVPQELMSPFDSLDERADIHLLTSSLKRQLAANIHQRTTPTPDALLPSEPAASMHDVVSPLVVLSPTDPEVPPQDHSSDCIRPETLYDANSGEQAPIVIGAILPLSSPGAYEAGFIMQFALNTANKAVNMSGGVNGQPVRLVTYDSAGIPRRGAMWADRLINLDCASLIVGLYHDNVARAVIDVASTYDVPVIIAGARDENLANANSPNVFQIMPASGTVDGEMVAFLENSFNADAEQFWNDDELVVSHIHENNNRARAAARTTQRLLEDAGMVVEPLAVDLPATDFSSDIARILASDMLPDAVIIDLPQTAALALRQQLDSVGIGSATGTLILIDGAGLEGDIAAALASGAPTILAWSGPWPSRANEYALAFAADYEKYFERWPDVTAFASYDALLLAVDAIERASSLSGPKLIAALDGTDVELAAGHYAFEPDASLIEVSNSPHKHQGRRLNPPVFFVQFPSTDPQSNAGDILWP